MVVLGGWMSGMVGWVDGWMDEWMVGWVGELVSWVMDDYDDE